MQNAESRRERPMPAVPRPFAIGDWLFPGTAPSARKSPIVNRKWPTWLGTVLLFLLLAGVALAEQRFPPPDFESGHQAADHDDARGAGGAPPVSRCGRARPPALGLGKLAGL